MAKTKTSFKPGHRKPAGSGRKAGQVNERTKEIRDIARGYLNDPEYQENLQRRLAEGKAPHMETLLHQYAYGKPKEVVGGDEQHPLRVLIEHVRRNLEDSGNGSA